MQIQPTLPSTAAKPTASAQTAVQNGAEEIAGAIRHQPMTGSKKTEQKPKRFTLKVNNPDELFAKLNDDGQKKDLRQVVRALRQRLMRKGRLSYADDALDAELTEGDPVRAFIALETLSQQVGQDVSHPGLQSLVEQQISALLAAHESVIIAGINTVDAIVQFNPSDKRAQRALRQWYYQHIVGHSAQPQRLVLSLVQQFNTQLEAAFKALFKAMASDMQAKHHSVPIAQLSALAKSLIALQSICSTFKRVKKMVARIEAMATQPAETTTADKAIQRDTADNTKAVELLQQLINLANNPFSRREFIEFVNGFIRPSQDRADQISAYIEFLNQLYRRIHELPLILFAPESEHRQQLLEGLQLVLTDVTAAQPNKTRL